MRISEKKDIPIILLLGFLGFSIYHTFLNIGERTVDAGTASLLVSTTPLLSALLAAFFLKEKFNRFGWFGSFIACMCLALISIETGGSFSLSIEWGALMMLRGALGVSFYLFFQSSYIENDGFYPVIPY